MLQVSIEGSEKFIAAIAKIRRTAPEKLQQVLQAGAEETRNMAVRSIQASQSQGRIYQRRSVEHTASKPGKPPNTDTGNLVSNITVQKIEKGFDVGSRQGAPYGLWLEFGTSKMLPRPWLAPAFKAAVATTLKALKRKKWT